MSCAFPSGCSCLQLRKPLLRDEATQGNMASAAVLDQQTGRQQLTSKKTGVMMSQKKHLTDLKNIGKKLAGRLNERLPLCAYLYSFQGP